jgi:hypothetical protein
MEDLFLATSTPVCLLHPHDVFLVKRAWCGKLHLHPQFLQKNQSAQLSSTVSCLRRRIHVTAIINAIRLLHAGNTCSATRLIYCTGVGSDIVLVSVRPPVSPHRHRPLQRRSQTPTPLHQQYRRRKILLQYLPPRVCNVRLRGIHVRSKS